MTTDTKNDVQNETSISESNLESAKNEQNSQSKTSGKNHFVSQTLEGIASINRYTREIPKSTEADVSETFDISDQTRDLVEHAIELWRMEQRLNKIITSLDKPQQNFFTNSIQKLKRYLKKNNIEIVEHTNQKFNSGKNLDVLLVEKLPDVMESIIKETKEPTILWNNKVVHKGKVIILEKSDEGDNHD